MNQSCCCVTDWLASVDWTLVVGLPLLGICAIAILFVIYRLLDDALTDAAKDQNK
jgi:hypothetical protein